MPAIRNLARKHPFQFSPSPTSHPGQSEIDYGEELAAQITQIWGGRRVRAPQPRTRSVSSECSRLPLFIATANMAQMAELLREHIKEATPAELTDSVVLCNLVLQRVIYKQSLNVTCPRIHPASSPVTAEAITPHGPPQMHTTEEPPAWNASGSCMTAWGLAVVMHYSRRNMGLPPWAKM